MAIQQRRGDYDDFDDSKMLAGEFAVVLQDDPNTLDGKAAYIAFSAGSAKRLMTAEDAEADIEAAISHVLSPPSVDGVYVLQCTVSSGEATYSWVTST